MRQLSRSLLIASLLAGALVSVPAPDACACSCAAVGLAERVADADLVARVRVEDVGRARGGGSAAEVTHRMRVAAVYRGSAPARIDVSTAASGASCGLEGVDAGKEYLLFADGSGTRWQASLCGGTTHWHDADHATLVRVAGTPHAPGPEESLPANPAGRLPVGGLALLPVLAAAAWWWRRRRVR